MFGKTFLQWLKQFERLQKRLGQAPRKRTLKYTFRPQPEELEERVTPAATPFTPAQLRAAYGIDQIKFGTTGTVGDGSGQTIALVVNGADSYLALDLLDFDQMFGPGPDGTQLLDTFAKDASGNYTDTGPAAGSTKPWLDIIQEIGEFAPGAANSRECLEADEDVEWAHAIAPMANVLVIETGSIASGIVVANEQTQLGVSVVAFSADNFPEQNFDPSNFMQPNVTYVGITGDTGTSDDSQRTNFSATVYPESSPDVLAVGGTTLTLNADGSYGSETGWGFASPNRFLTSATVSLVANAHPWMADNGGFSGTYYSTMGTPLPPPQPNTATWTTTVLASDTLGINDGGLEISATWPASLNAADNAEYLVSVNGNVVDATSVNQQLAPNGPTGTLGSSTATFEELCTLTHVVVGDTIQVQLITTQADGDVIADAIGIGPDDAGGGGLSYAIDEPQPTFQNNLVIHDGNSVISSGGARAIPDVAFDGDYINSPVIIYDQGSHAIDSSLPLIRQGAGTSLGAPCWGAMIAIADQGLATVGQAPMDTADALAGLYSLPSSDFHDETSGYNGYSAGPGYDLVTGLGSPIANQLIPDLDNAVLYVRNPTLDLDNTEPQVSGPLVYEAPEGQGPNNLYIFRFGPIVGIDDNGQIVATKTVAGTTAFDIIGANNTTNTLSIDFDLTVTGAGIIPDLAYPVGVPVAFDGGALGGGSGTLILTDGTFTTEIDGATGPHSGTISLDSTVITYTNLAPIIDTTTAASFTINDPMAGDHITVQNDPDSPEDGIATSEISGGGFEKIDFANKTNVIFNNTSGAAADTFDLIDPLVNGGTLTTNASPAITNGPPTSTAFLGKSYAFQYTASGSPAPSFTHSGTLPTGLTLSPAGLLSGTDTNAADVGQTFTGTVVAGNGIGSNATQAYSITVILTSPTIVASPGATVVLGTGAKLTASATLGGGNSETGAIAFTLYAPNNTVVDTETVAASGNSTYATPNGYLPSVSGTYQWVASYAGDDNNNSASTHKGSTPEVVVGPGATVVGNALYLVGGKTNDQLNIAPIGASPTGCTGITVHGQLNGINVNNIKYTQAFAVIYLVGFGGNDTFQFTCSLAIPTVINDGDGFDNLQLGNGNNVVTVGNGIDNIQGGNGNNTVTVGNGTDSVQLGNGNNVVRAGNGNDFIRAGDGTNVVTAGAVGSSGNIRVELGNGANDRVTLLGNGNDQVQVGNGNDDSVSVSGNGNDQIQVGNGTNDSVALVGNGNETIQTGTGTGTLHVAGTGKKNLHLRKGWTQI